jgi:hypothetical protein
LEENKFLIIKNLKKKKESLGFAIFKAPHSSWPPGGYLKQGVCQLHYGLAIYIIKYLKANEEELWKLKYFTIAKNIMFKKSSKRNPKSFKIS